MWWSNCKALTHFIYCRYITLPFIFQFFYILVSPCHIELFRKPCSGVNNGQSPTFLKGLELYPSLCSAFFHFPFPHRSSRIPVVFTTRLPRVLGCATVNLNSVLGPGSHIALAYFATAGQAGDLVGRQDPVPKTHLGQLSNQGLGWVKTSTQRILERKKSEVRWITESMWLKKKIKHFYFYAHTGSPSTDLLPWARLWEYEGNVITFMNSGLLNKEATWEGIFWLWMKVPRPFPHNSTT